MILCKTLWRNWSLFYLISTNNIKTNIVINKNISLFADDTKKFSESNVSLQSTLDNIYKGLKTRKLDLNSNKCKILIIRKTNR